MERLTQEADFGLEDWEETLFLVKSDPNGAYNILDIASHVGTQEFDEILINIALRLAEIENILGDDYNYGLLSELVTAFKEGRYIIMRDAESEGVARLLELSEADREGRCVVLPCNIGTPVYRILWHCGCAALDDESYQYVASFPAPFTYDMINEFGKSVFLTSEEAEAALKASDVM